MKNMTSVEVFLVSAYYIISFHFMNHILGKNRVGSKTGWM
jgi:hypothetical protein